MEALCPPVPRPPRPQPVTCPQSQGPAFLPSPASPPLCGAAVRAGPCHARLCALGSCHYAGHTAGAQWVFVTGTPCRVLPREVVSALGRRQSTLSFQGPESALHGPGPGNRPMCLPQEQAWGRSSFRGWEAPVWLVPQASLIIAHVCGDSPVSRCLSHPLFRAGEWVGQFHSLTDGRPGAHRSECGSQGPQLAVGQPALTRAAPLGSSFWPPAECGGERSEVGASQPDRLGCRLSTSLLGDRG